MATIVVVGMRNTNCYVLRLHQASCSQITLFSAEFQNALEGKITIYLETYRNNRYINLLSNYLVRKFFFKHIVI